MPEVEDVGVDEDVEEVPLEDEDLSDEVSFEDDIDTVL